MSQTTSTNRFARLIVTVVAVFTLAIAATLSSANATEKTHEFVGAKKCKMCHNKPKVGNQYKIWLDTKHANAFKALASDEAKKAAKKAGVKDAQKSGKCLKCHSTAYDHKETLAKNLKVKKSTGKPYLTVEEGVSCESCHFAGSDFKKKKIMKDKDLAIANGLNPEPKKACLKCHNDESPFWDAARYKLADGKTTGFDFDQAWAKIKHLIPKKKGAK